MAFIRRLSGWGLALALLLWSVQRIDPADALRSIAGIGPALLLVLVPQLVGLSLETWAWRAVLAHVGHPVRFWNLWGIRVGTEAIGQMLPGGALLGESIKPKLLATHCQLPISVGVAATAHRKYVRLLAHGVYVIGGTLLGLQALRTVSTTWLGRSGLEVLLLFVGLGLLLAALCLRELAGRGRLAERLHGVLLWLPVPRWRRAIAARTLGFRETDRSTRGFFSLDSRRLLLPVGACTTAWCCEALESWLILQLLGSSLGFEGIVGLELVIALARQTLFLLPAGLGVQEAGYITGLSALDPGSLALLGGAFVVLKRVKELCWGALGLGALWLMGSSTGKRSNRNRARGDDTSNTPNAVPVSGAESGLPHTLSRPATGRTPARAAVG